MSARGRRMFNWMAIHFTVVPILFYQVHQFGYDKGYKVGIKEAKENMSSNNKDTNKNKKANRKQIMQ